MCHVLIIEDDWFIADYLTDLVRDSGATSVFATATQCGAVDAAREHRPRIILSDVMLLEGTGPRAVRAILDEHGHVPVIFITASPEACRPCDPLQIILPKPIDRGAVVGAFRRLAALDRDP